VNRKIDDMVTVYIQTAEIIIQCETQVGKGSCKSFSQEVCVDVKRLLDFFQRQRIQMNVLVFDNAKNVIKEPFALKTVSVNDEQEKEKGNEGESILSEVRDMNAHGKFEGVV